MFSPRTRAAGESRHKEAPAVQEEDSAMTLPSQLADERKMGRTNVAVSPSDSSLLQPQKPPRDERALDYEDFLVVRELCLAGSSHVHAVVFSDAKGGSATSAGVARVEGRRLLHRDVALVQRTAASSAQAPLARYAALQV